jgi:hypothetical protein
MKENETGANTIAYLRGEKDLVREREKIAQFKKEQPNGNFPPGFSFTQKRRIERFWKVASLLQENSRMGLTDISKELKIPIGTVFDIFEELKKAFLFTIVLKECEKGLVKEPLAFEFSYQASNETGAEKGRQCTLGSE